MAYSWYVMVKLSIKEPKTRAGGNLADDGNIVKQTVCRFRGKLLFMKNMMLREYSTSRR
jgi:hypothetical protein